MEIPYVDIVTCIKFHSFILIFPEEYEDCESTKYFSKPEIIIFNFTI